MEKRIRISTHGRVTIPKILRDKLNILDGQPIVVRSVAERRELVIEILPTMSDYK